MLIASELYYRGDLTEMSDARHSLMDLVIFLITYSINVIYED